MRDSSQTVEEYIKGKISIVGENINVARFVRFNLGERARTGKTEAEAEYS